MRRVLWTVALVLVFWSPEAAQAQFLDDDCSLVCSTEGSCSSGCLWDDPYDEEGEPMWITCYEYGLCDIDPDDDNVVYNDNCPNTYNPDQGDCDGDSIGNVCDGQNATWQPAQPIETCHIYDRRHTGYVDVTMVREQLLLDVSNCYGTQYGGTGIAWQRSEVRGKCYGFWPDAYSCCVSWFGSSECALHFGNNTCATG